MELAYYNSDRSVTNKHDKSSVSKYPFRQRGRVLVVANRQIRAPQVRVLSDQGEALGVMSTNQAIEKAWNEDKDLVLINDKQDPPVAKIIDVAKHKYQLAQKQAEGRKKAKSQDLKEIRLKPFMGENDLLARQKRVIEFLEKGDKVRLVLQFRGREITKQEFGRDVVAKVIEAASEVAELEFEPKMMGKRLIAQLMPKKK